MLGTPTHSNIGDSAIVLAESMFLKRCGVNTNRIKELTVKEIIENAKTVFHCIRSCRSSVICWHGGGNLGDQWLNEEHFRRDAIVRLPNTPIILFPQTIYYTPTANGKSEELASIPYYTGHPELTMVAREQTSFDEMRRLYSETEILLTPDIVLSCSMEDFGARVQERKGILFCIRSDVEKSVENAVWQDLQTAISEMGIPFRMTDMIQVRLLQRKTALIASAKKCKSFAARNS